MRFQPILKWTLIAHACVIAIALFAKPKARTIEAIPVRVTTIRLKPPTPKPVLKAAPKPIVQKAKGEKKSVPPLKKSAAAAQKKASPPAKKAVPKAIALPLDFQQLLAAKLKEQLELPELGAVELKISFTEKGVIEKIEVVASKSQKNTDYLLKALKKIELPQLPRGTRGSLEPLIVEFDSNI